MHYAEKGCARHTESQASNHMRFEIYDKCIAETFVHEGNALVIGGISARSPKCVSISMLAGR